MQVDDDHTAATTTATPTEATTNGTDAAAKAQYLCEGSAQILNEGNVFYNPVQQFNRDLSLSVISTFSRIHQAELAVKRQKQAAARARQQKQQQPAAPTAAAVAEESAEPAAEVPPELVAGRKLDTGLVILEALSATGLRSIRYAQEIPGVQRIVANDLSRQAIAAIQHNVRHNGVEHLVEVSHADAMTLMYTSTAPERRFTVVDLDPYGAPTRFLDGAVQALADGGLLCVTATDMAVLAGGTPEACYVKYGSIPVRSKACHEMALRILLRTIESTATRYGRYIRPLLSVSADFYIRIFVRVFSGPAECKRSSSRQSMVFQCTGCDTLTLQPLGVTRPNPSATNPAQVKFGTPTGPFVDAKCEHCGHRHHVSIDSCECCSSPDVLTRSVRPCADGRPDLVGPHTRSRLRGRPARHHPLRAVHAPRHAHAHAGHAERHRRGAARHSAVLCGREAVLGAQAGGGADSAVPFGHPARRLPRVVLARLQVVDQDGRPGRRAVGHPAVLGENAPGEAGTVHGGQRPEGDSVA